MIEQGTVTEILADGRAKVNFKSGRECVKCGACFKNGEQGYVEALNGTGAKKGDTVRVEIPPQKVLQATFLLFIIPPVALIAGYFVAGILSSFVMFFLSFLLLYLYDRRFQGEKTFCRIIEVV